MAETEEVPSRGDDTVITNTDGGLEPTTSDNMADTEEIPSQADGAGVPNAGSGLEPTNEFDVEVKLIDPNSPLYSVHSFQDLKL